MLSVQRHATRRATTQLLLAKTLVARHVVELSYQLFHSTTPVLQESSGERGFHFDSRLAAHWQGSTDDDGGDSMPTKTLKYTVPQRVRQKLISASDAVALVRSGDTVCVSGFVTQGAPEAILKALGERFEATGDPANLTLLFGGGPGDFGERGLSHLAKTKGDVCMLKRTIGGHYGQVPKVAELALKDVVEAWTLPMGSISRMIRAQSTHSPGHITNVGLGTYVDPDISGGAANESASKSPLHSQLVTKIDIGGQKHLMYKALPINIAIIRGTTADGQGNITVEHESLLCDQKIIAAAAKNSGGIVIAQVKRIASEGSIPSRNVAIPGPLVDCVVLVEQKDHHEDHGMGYFDYHNPGLTGELVAPEGEVETMSLDIRKIIARRSFFGLKPNKIVNLGIGLPEGVASVAAEEGMLEYVTLSTEPGVFGGLPASGHNFGPAYNASSLMEMNQMFDFYDGGGLDMSFLGAAQISQSGDVNVSRMSKDRLTGPGGFIDISQSTKNIVFMSPLTTKGLEITTGHGKLYIEKEGEVKKFVTEVFEKTFSGDEAVRRGQQVFYVTERAVFRRTAKHDKLELIEIAPGIDLQKDVLDQMDFVPAVSPNLKMMDPRIFHSAKMNVTAEFFGSLDERCNYHSEDHTMYIDLFGITLNEEQDVNWFIGGLRDILSPLVLDKGPINIVVNYDGFDLGKGLERSYSEKVALLEKDFYKSVRRYTGQAFRRAQLKTQLKMSDYDPDELFETFDVDHSGSLDLEQLRECFQTKFQIRLSTSDIILFQQQDESVVKVNREMFAEGVRKVLEGGHH